MGCGSSKDVPTETKRERKKSVFEPNIPVINVNFGANVAFQPPPATKVIFIIGGPGSGKGRIVASLSSMFGFKLISSESAILRYLPKKVQHVMTLSSTDEMADLVKKEPTHVNLEWVLRLLQHYIESDPDQVFIVDIVPNLKWLVRNEHLIKECSSEMESFEQKIPISFAIHLSLTEDSLNKTLDYSHSHHDTNLPPGATVADEADNSRAKRRFLMHNKAAQPFIDYFKTSDRMITIDVSSGAMEPIWDKVHEVFTNMDMVAWRPVDSVLVFAMEGMRVGNLDLSNCDMQVVRLKDIVTDPDDTVESLLEALSIHIDTLADKSHYFVIDPSDTAIMKQTMGGVHRNSIVFSDVREHNEGCVNKFSIRLNSLVGGEKPYFRAVCSSEDETLLFPATTSDQFCQQMAITMAELHPSKR